MASYFCDGSIGTDTGAGTVGDPWGAASGSAVQRALNLITQGSSGDQVNIKNTDTLGAALDLTTYGTTSETQPLLIRGYTTSENDGGIGTLDGAATYSIWGGNQTYVHMKDIHATNSGAAIVVDLGAGCSLIDCEIDTTTSSAVDLGTSLIFNCNIHTFGTNGITGSGFFAYNNYVSDASATVGIDMNSQAARAIGNIVTIGGATDGIWVAHDNQVVMNNSILSSGGTGTGIDRIGNRYGQAIINNLIEGFSGVGGIGIDTSGLTESHTAMGYNAVYDCETAYSAGSTPLVVDLGDDETLGASPFAKSGADNFSNRATYFAPVDTGNVVGGAY